MKKLVKVIFDSSWSAFLWLVAVLIVSTIGGLAFQLGWNYVAHVYWADAPRITVLQGMCTMALADLIVVPLNRKTYT